MKKKFSKDKMKNGVCKIGFDAFSPFFVLNFQTPFLNANKITFYFRLKYFSRNSLMSAFFLSSTVFIALFGY